MVVMLGRWAFGGLRGFELELSVLAFGERIGPAERAEERLMQPIAAVVKSPSEVILEGWWSRLAEGLIVWGASNLDFQCLRSAGELECPQVHGMSGLHGR